ncbi:serine/threonine protein kinase [Methylohalomonas lacus]|uniref:Serine/threonine protein kinase n=1 Tax=Methylohalomonas lacus TaxID=398773 RepID=A0AAE3L4Y0_9GAMM|nr:serine/threonine-protein kinase [Methylohalomonas lacus]MCS3902337.1 serine/threonine protein kinase [Methylohalomonas lacus]
MINTIPDKLGKYEVRGQISRGSMGIVYLGHDPYADRPVAIKVALSESLNDPHSGERYRKMFFNEAHTAGMLKHPNIISIFDAGTDDDNCYIVMEFIDGGQTLKDFCRVDNLLPVERVIEIVFKCAKALDYAHRQGIVHRDIKPSNILITPDQDIKIGDFSIAHINKADSTETMPLGMIGSPRYMSPEQLREDFVTSQSDLFSLGVVMYELLTGRHPFYAENFSRLVSKILNEEPPAMRGYRTELPGVLEDIFRKAVAKDINERHRMGLDLASDLSRAFDSLEGPSEEVSSQEQFYSVKNLEFFLGFPDVEIWEILRASTWQDYGMDEEIIVEGDLDDCFYIIVGGSVAVKKGGSSIRVLGKGDCFGEMGYLAKTKRTATITAEEKTSLLKINSTVISQVSMNCQVRFLKVFLRTMIHRLSTTTERLSA